MIRQRLIFFIGLWVALLPFLGFPKNFRTVLFVLTGISLIAISYFMYIQTKAIEENAPAKPKSVKKSKKKIKSDLISNEQESVSSVGSIYNPDVYSSAEGEQNESDFVAPVEGSDNNTEDRAQELNEDEL